MERYESEAVIGTCTRWVPWIHNGTGLMEQVEKPGRGIAGTASPDAGVFLRFFLRPAPRRTFELNS